MIRKILLSVLAVVAFSFATARKDFYFMDSFIDGLCISKKPVNASSFNNRGTKCSSNNRKNVVRIRVVEPVEDASSRYGVALNRPFFILDGIYLGTDGVRTLSALENEANRLGIMDVLVELGYTPVLVQFSESVRRPLVQNAEYFAKLLRFLNQNSSIGFVNKLEDGMVVMGISQGGILGRFGAYLYDVERDKKTDAPIRFYASLDSPHQGAVLPLSLYYTIDFWATLGGSSAAEAFRDLLKGPGASGLLLYEGELLTKMFYGVYEYKVNHASDRFLFGAYRSAAEYKGFPSVLVAQGQLKGVNPSHSDTYFILNRYAKKFGVLLGRAESEMYSSNGSSKTIANNRVYEIGDDRKTESRGDARYDFIQGSTYPFAETMYQSLKAGFEDAMPDNMKTKVFGAHLSLSTAWDKDELLQKNSTFIPTASAMDLKCSGNLAIRENCAFRQNSQDFPFTKPGSRSSADAVYAVDPSHPRYKESISGRHIELPESVDDHKDSIVVEGFRVDMWRILCELANVDYDHERKEFRNENLAPLFAPGTNCMDQSKMPLLLKNSGKLQKKIFAYSNYDYSKTRASREEWNSFDVPAGWHKVASFDYGGELPENSTFEVDIKVDKAKGNWMKAELLLLKSKSGVSHVQLQEVDVPVDGGRFTARWKLPANKETLRSYRWFRLVLNSDGASVSVKEPRLIRSIEGNSLPTAKVAKNIYPNSDYKTVGWNDATALAPYSDALGTGLEAQFTKGYAGFHFDFNGMKSMDGYSGIKVTYWPGTCMKTGVYFDSFQKHRFSLKNGTKSGNFMNVDIPLSKIVDVSLTPQNKYAAFRLNLQSLFADEKCIVKAVSLY
jgi:hypothetical protein